MSNLDYPEGYVEVKNICPNRSAEDFLAFMNTTLEECKGKNITSIGGGFGIFEMTASQSGANVTIVDPIFKDSNTRSKRGQENYERLHNKKGVKAAIKLTNELSSKIDSLSQELSELLTQDDGSDVAQTKIDKAQKILYGKIGTRNELLIKKARFEKICKHIESREKNYKNSNLKLNPSVGSNILNIGNDSQDIVLIGHTLSHIYNKYHSPIEEIKKTLKEGLKILSNDGKLWIIDYKDDMLPIEEYLKTKDASKYKSNGGSFSYRFDKQSLKDFITNYFNK